MPRGLARILITASGGGHTGYARAVALHLAGRHQLVFAIRRGDGWSRSRLAGLGRVYETWPGRSPGDPVWRSIGLARSLYDSLRLPRVDAALCTGHNHSIPPCIAAWLRGAKLILLEDVYRISGGSRSVRLLSPISTLVALHWREQLGLYSRGVVVGPVYEPPTHRPWDGGYVLVTTGSHGFKRLFDTILGLAGRWRLVLQTGRVDPEPYRRAGVEAFRFDPDIERWIAGASVVVTHIGVTAVNAALGYGKPVVIVYNPEWRLAAPPQDARVVASRIGARFLERLTLDGLAEAVEGALASRPPRIPSGAAKLARLVEAASSYPN